MSVGSTRLLQGRASALSIRPGVSASLCAFDRSWAVGYNRRRSDRHLRSRVIRHTRSAHLQQRCGSLPHPRATRNGAEPGARAKYDMQMLALRFLAATTSPAAPRHIDAGVSISRRSGTGVFTRISGPDGRLWVSLPGQEAALIRAKPPDFHCNRSRTAEASQSHQPRRTCVRSSRRR